MTLVAVSAFTIKADLDNAMKVADFPTKQLPLQFVLQLEQGFQTCLHEIKGYNYIVINLRLHGFVTVYENSSI